MSPRLWPPLVCLLLLATVLGCYAYVLSLSYTGVDAAPLVWANQLDSPGAVARVLSQEVRGGIEPEVAFYRPWTGLSFGLDRLIHGSRLWGFHAVDLLVHLVSCLLLVALLRALDVGRVAATVGGLFLAVHPLGADVVPALARRADLWAVMWLLAASLCWVKGPRRWAGPLGLLACLSKETGFAWPLLVLGLEATRAGGRSWKSALGAIAWVIPALVARTAVLGGWGGYSAEISGAWGELPGAMARLFDPVGPLGGAVSLGLLALVLLSAGVALRRPQARPLVVLGLVWAGTHLLLTLPAGGPAPRYLYAAVPGAAILAMGGNFLSSRRVAVGVMALVPALLQAPVMPMDKAWRETSRHVAAWIAAGGPLCEEGASSEAQPAAVVGLPFQVKPVGSRIGSASAFLDYSYEAALGLTYGHRPHLDVLAYVDIVRPDARYTTQLQENSFFLRIEPIGPVKFWRPRDTKTPAHDAAKVTLGLSGGDRVVTVVQPAVWLWREGRLVQRELRKNPLE